MAGDGIDPRALPEDVRADYDLFAQRCSKCHSLARPLSSGIDDDDYWVIYVARMRRQPGSGISQDDTVVILRFLHYYSVELQKKKKGKLDPRSASPSASGTSWVDALPWRGSYAERRDRSPGSTWP
jgi:hypothetical protein